MFNHRRTPDRGEPIEVDHNHTTSHRLAALARDPALISGIYDTCDQWCMYCPLTDRCLAFRCTGAGEGAALWNPATADGEGIGEGLMVFKALADAEHRRMPPEIDAALSADRERQRKVFMLDDPLERIGRGYMLLAEAYLKSRADFPPDIRWRPSGATPLEVLTWYHVLAPARVFRAILCVAEAREGVGGRHRDALAAAKVALIGIDRSLNALAALGAEGDDPRVEIMRDRLCSLRDEVEKRFPRARTFARPGLDDPAGAPARLRHFEFLWGPLRRVRTLLHWRHERPADATPGDLRGSARGAGAPRG